MGQTQATAILRPALIVLLVLNVNYHLKKLSSSLTSGMQRVRVHQRLVFVAPSKAKLYDEVVFQAIIPGGKMGMSNKSEA